MGDKERLVMNVTADQKAAIYSTYFIKKLATGNCSR